MFFFFFFQAEDGIRDGTVTGVQTCALPISAVEPRNMNRQWEKVRDRAGITRPARLHDLRHACASYALAGGADLKTVQRMLRHARISTTQVYVHALEDVPRAGAD